MAAVTVTGVALTGLLTYRQVTRAIHDEAQQRLFESTLSLGTELKALSSNAQAALSEASHSPDFRNRFDALTRGDLGPGSWEIRGLAPRLMERVNLDFLELLNQEGRVLSVGQWSTSYGRPDSAAWEIVTQRGSFPSVHLRLVKDESVVAVESFIRLDAAPRTYYLVGGYALTPERVRDMGRRTGGSLYVEMANGSRIVPTGVVAQDLGRLVDARLQEMEGTRFLTGRPATGEAAGISRYTIRRPDGTAFGDFVLRISQARLTALVGELSGTFLALGAGVVVFAWGIGFWFARRITRPIEELAVAARRVGSGRAPGPMPAVTADEVGDLVRSFSQMTTDLSESRQQLVRAERIAAWREIARRMAHEIKNSLSPIQICVETIRRSHETGREDFDEIMAEAVQTVTDEVNSLKNLVNDFSRFARMPELLLKPEAPGPIVERAAALHEKNNRGISIVRSIDRSLPFVAIDSDALSRAVGNIVLNAVEASPEGSSVRLSAGSRGDLVEIQVDDCGSGVAVSERERIFEPYYTTKEGGSGLGLAIAYKIISEHGGRIEIEDSPIGGSRFRIILPALVESPERKARA